MATETMSVPVPAKAPRRPQPPGTQTRRPPGLSGKALAALTPGIIFAVLAFVAPLLVTHSPTQVAGAASLPPSAEHWFGTDSAGMDVFSRSIAATQVDLGIAAAVTLIATVGGLVLGLLIGMGESKRGPWGLGSRTLARVLDLADAVPVIVVAMVVVAMFGATSTTLIVTLAVVLVPNPARLTRAEVLRVRTEGYLEAARQGGMSETRLSFRHVLPNASIPAVENMSVIFGLSMAVAAALGFLGVGIAPPIPEWGAMVARGASDMISGRWWSAVFPSVMLGAAILSCALAGGVLTKSIKR